MREYMLNRYNERRQRGFELLGGKCAICGCIPSEFEFDHIDPSTKEFTVSGYKWNVPEDVFYNELKKCQILCKPCHMTKTIKSSGKIEVKGKDIHGTLSSYRYCKCDACRLAKRRSNKQQSIKREQKKLLEKQKGSIESISDSSKIDNSI